MKKMHTPKKVLGIAAKNWLLQAAFLLLGFAAFAQQSIHGKILDDKGSPLSRATIQVKGANQTTQTDQQGNFTLSVPSTSSKLIVSMVGYKKLEVPVDGKTELTISLAEFTSELNQV